MATRSRSITAHHRHLDLRALDVAGGLFGFTAMLPYIAMLGLSVVAGFNMQGLFQSYLGRARRFPPRYRGGTIGLYSCIGFAPGFSEHFCSASRSKLAAWALSFGTCGLDCLAGATRHHFPALEHLIWQR